jgi:hypothetical protein
MSKFIAVALVAAMLAPSAALAGADVMRCTFPDGFELYVTRTDDDTGRIGVAAGVGDRARTFFDTTGTRVVVEFNAVGLPITFTTIQDDGSAVHSRQIVDVSGRVVAPSQVRGSCAFKWTSKDEPLGWAQ